jgi:nitroreductase
MTGPQDIGLFHALYTTRSLRRFRPDPIPDEVLFQLFDAAIRAPSHSNAQDWRFLVITDAALKRRMQDWAAEGWSRYYGRFVESPEAIDALPRGQRLSLRSTAHLVEHLVEVPAVIAVCSLRGKQKTPGSGIFPAVQNLLLAARGLGLGSSIFNFPLSHRDELMQALGIPDSNEINCLLPIGYPTDRQGPVRRKPVRRVVYRERWGEAWAFAAAQPDEGWRTKWVTAAPPSD